MLVVARAGLGLGYGGDLSLFEYHRGRGVTPVAYELWAASVNVVVHARGGSVLALSLHFSACGSVSCVALGPVAFESMDLRARFAAELVAEDFQGQQDVLDSITELLVFNQFTGLSNLALADHPREWEDADKVSPEGLSFLNQASGKHSAIAPVLCRLMCMSYARFATSCGVVADPGWYPVNSPWPCWGAGCLCLGRRLALELVSVS